MIKSILVVWLTVFCVDCSFCVTNFDSLPSQCLVGRDTVPSWKVLPNGFKYFVIKNNLPPGQVHFRLTVGVGSSDEDEEELGVSHLLEHMAFVETDHFRDAMLTFQKRGLTRGNDINAKTGSKATDYYINIPTGDSTLFNEAMLFLRDCAGGIRLKKENVEREKGVVLAEIESDFDDFYLSQVEVDKALRGDGKVSKTLKDPRDNLSLVRFETVVQFYRRWYAPDKQGLVVVGDVDVDSVEAAIKTVFAGLKNNLGNIRCPKRVQRKSKAYSGINRHVSVEYADAGGLQLQMFIKDCRVKRETVSHDSLRRFTAISLFNQLLVQRLSRLARYNLVDPSTIVYRDEKGAIYQGNCRCTIVSATLKSDSLESDAFRIGRQLATLIKFGFSENEIEIGKRFLVSSNFDLPITSFQLANYFAGCIASGKNIQNLAALKKRMKNILVGISQEELDSLSREFLTPTTNIDLVLVFPPHLRRSIPLETNLLKLLSPSNKFNLSPINDDFREEQLDTELQRTLVPTAYKQSEVKKINTTQLDLTNGIVVMLRSTETDIGVFGFDQVLIEGFRRGGLSNINDTLASAAEQSVNIVQKLNSQLEHRLNGRGYVPQDGIYANLFINDSFEGVTASAPIKNVELAMQLVFKRFTEFRQLKLNDYLKGNQQDTLKALKVYQSKFGDVGGFAFVITGRFQMDSMIALVSKYIGNLPSSSSQDVFKMTSGIHQKKKPKLFEPLLEYVSGKMSTVSLAYSTRVKYDLRAEVVFNILSEAIRSALNHQLRYVDGSVYDVAVGRRIDPIGGDSAQFTFEVGFTYPDCDVQKLVDACLGVFESLSAKGVSHEEFILAVSNERRRIEQVLTSHVEFNAYLLGQLKARRDIEEIKDYGYIIDQFSPSDVANAARIFLNNGDLIKRLSLSKEKCL